MELYEKLTARRKEIGMSLDDLVEASQVPKGTVAKIMSGHIRNPGIETLKAITYALGLTLEDLSEKKEPAMEDGLTKEENEFLSLFTSMTPGNRRLILGIAQLLLQEQAGPPDSPD